VYKRQALYRDGVVASPVADLRPNEFVLLRDSARPKHSAMARCRADGNVLKALSRDSEKTWNISARSAAQRMALELLLDDSVRLVTLVGPAGTGKTLLALAAGLTLVLKEQRFDKLFVSRPIVPLGRDIGYLPGGKEEKLAAWMGPIFDNLKFLLCGKSCPVKITPEQMMERDLLEIEAITYIRGRSIPNAFMIVDEAQNLTPHEVKTVISRAGEGAKMVLTGDPDQIDNPYLDASSNGLSYCADRMRGSPLHGHVALLRSERSELAELAASRL
ncbi:MAG: PhoH family protein, partial [Planctomycetota bacterium]|nr:PhoH family protein [Planctomycetota bacterium]